jgi:hypothetical protein
MRTQFTDTYIDGAVHSRDHGTIEEARSYAIEKSKLSRGHCTLANGEVYEDGIRTKSPDGQ